MCWQRYIEVSWIVFLAHICNMFKMNLIRCFYENLTQSMDGIVAHLACFHSIGLILLGVGELHPIHIGRRRGGKESQLSGGIGMHEACFIRYRCGCSPLGGRCGFGCWRCIGVCRGFCLAIDVCGSKGQEAVRGWVDWDEKSLIFS